MHEFAWYASYIARTKGTELPGMQIPRKNNAVLYGKINAYAYNMHMRAYICTWTQCEKGEGKLLMHSKTH
jgi:hypothetical protein